MHAVPRNGAAASGSSRSESRHCSPRSHMPSPALRGVARLAAAGGRPTVSADPPRLAARGRPGSGHQSRCVCRRASGAACSRGLDEVGRLKLATASDLEPSTAGEVIPRAIGLGDRSQRWKVNEWRMIAGRAGLRAARRTGRDRHERRSLRLRPGEAPEMDHGRLRHGLRERGEHAGHRPDVPGPRLHREERADLLGIFITHAHEDHIGAIAELWPRMRCRSTRRASPRACSKPGGLVEPGAPKVDLRKIRPGRAVTLGPFEVEYVPVSHSIPESNALAIRTPRASCSTPATGRSMRRRSSAVTTTEAPSVGSATRAFSRSFAIPPTSARRSQPDAKEVAKALAELVADAPHRVAVTTFASNVARLRAVAEAAALAAARSSWSAGRWTGSSRSRASAAISTGCPVPRPERRRHSRASRS